MIVIVTIVWLEYIAYICTRLLYVFFMVLELNQLDIRPACDR